MADLKVEIISIEGVLFNGSCNMAVVPSINGDVGVMYGHESIIVNLRQGEINLYDNSNNIIKSVSLEKGFAEMQGEEKLLILINS